MEKGSELPQSYWSGIESAVLERLPRGPLLPIFLWVPVALCQASAMVLTRLRCLSPSLGHSARQGPDFTAGQTSSSVNDELFGSSQMI